MTKDFCIIIPKSLIGMNLADFLINVYKEYEGTVFIPETTEFRLIGEDYRKLIPPNNFAALKEYENKIAIFVLSTSINPSLWVSYPPDTHAFPTVIFGMNYIVTDRPERIPIIKRNFQDVMDFSKLLMKQSGAEYFYGGMEARSEDFNVDRISLLYCKADSYFEKIKGYIEHKLKVSLTREEVEELINTEGRIERDGEYVTIYFFDIAPKMLVGALSSSVEKFIEDKKKPGEM